MKYIIHKAIELDKLSPNKRPTEAELADHSLYVWQPKIDGCNMVAVVNSGTVRLLSRTGHEVKSADHLKIVLAKKPSGVYLGEYVIPHKSFPIVSGCFRNQSEQFPNAMFFVFDCLSLAEFNTGTDRPYTERLKHIQSMFPCLSDKAALVPTGDRKSAEAYMSTHPELGYDGIIVRKARGGWAPGSTGTTGEIIKLKTKLSVDLVVKDVGVSKGAKTGRSVYTLELLYKGMDIVVGSGVPHNKKELPKRGDIVEVEYLGITDTGVLREPRFKGVRHDKLAPDE